MPNQYSTLPSLIQQSTRETIAWGVDVTALVTSGSPSAPTTALLDQGTGLPVTLVDAPTLAGNIVSQIIRGTALVAGHTYLLSVLITIAGNILDNEVVLQCPD